MRRKDLLRREESHTLEIRASEPNEASGKLKTLTQEEEPPKEKHLEKVEHSSLLEKDVTSKVRSEESDEPTKASEENRPPDKVLINDDHPEQPITIKGNLHTECRSELIKTPHKHADAFAWIIADMSGIPCFVAEHQLKTYPHIEPRVQKKRSRAPDRRKVVKEEVEGWIKSRIVKRAQYYSWVANPVLVKKADGCWRMCIDFKDLNKACPKYLYSLPKIDWKIEFPDGIQIQMFLRCLQGVSSDTDV
ncbi:hypothetical protein Tco_0735731 [Tanacetum coccineum]